MSRNMKEYLDPPIELTLPKKAVRAYKRHLTHPKAIADFWQMLVNSSIEAHIKRVEKDKKSAKIDRVIVPECDYSQKEIQRLRRQGLWLVYNPGLKHPILGHLFPTLDSYCLDPKSEIASIEQTAGWVDVERALVSPHQDTTEEQAREIIRSQGRKIQRLSTFIWASQASRLLIDHYLDESTWSRVTLDSNGEHISTVSTLSRNRLGVMLQIFPQLHFPNLGVRSECADERS